MIDLFRAEWTKVVGHRGAMFWLLGIFPIGALIFFFASALAVKKSTMVRVIEAGLADWTDLMLLAWLIPSNLFGRLFLLALIAFVFAGEYQWGTWKNLTPRQPRARLVLIKFFTVSLLVALCFFFLSLLLPAGGMGLSNLAGVSTVPPLNFTEVRAFAPDYFLAASLAFLAFLITGIFAALGAIYSKTILGGTLAGMVAVFLDPALLYASNLLARLFEIPSLLHLQRLVPLYNIENIRSWLTSQSGASMLKENFQALELTPPVDGTVFSVILLLAWIVVGIRATIFVFERQDITT